MSDLDEPQEQVTHDNDDIAEPSFLDTRYGSQVYSMNTGVAMAVYLAFQEDCKDNTCYFSHVFRRHYTQSWISNELFTCRNLRAQMVSGCWMICRLLMMQCNLKKRPLV